MESALVRFGIPLIALCLATLFVAAVWLGEAKAEPSARRRRTAFAALGVVLWLGGVAALASSGLLARFDLRPPPMALWFAATLLVPLGLGLSSFGRRLALGTPLAALVGFQAFRLPLELVMHRAAIEGVMPRAMSYSGYNFDIVSGVTALALGLLLSRGSVPRVVVLLWNVLGLVLLAVIAAVAFAASPLFKAFGDDQVNTWVTRFPYAWINLMVASALFGHVLVFRKLYGTPASVHRDAALRARRELECCSAGRTS